MHDAEDQARFFASVISGKQIDCKLAMDYESFQGASVEMINAISNAFLNKVRELTGKETIIYSDIYNAQNRFDKELAGNYPLWLAYYGDYNNTEDINVRWSKWTGIQYSDRGNVSGIRGSVDRDVFTKQIFLGNSDKTPDVVHPNNSSNSNVVEYVVKSGDTLWGISRRYNTTISKIVNLNNISNPNLIYPGEVLKIITNSNLNGTENRATGKIIYTVKSRRYSMGNFEKIWGIYTADC